MTDAAEARIAELEARLAKATHERDEYRKLYELVMMELERVKRHLRAQNGSERVDAAQVQLAFSQVASLVVPPELAAQIAEAENKDRAEKKFRGPHGRNKIPEHLPVERVEIHPPEALRTCRACHSAMHVIGEETSDKYHWRPGTLVRFQTARLKYACSCERGGVVIAEVPDAPVERGLATPSLLAHVVISKYQDHVPMNRLVDIFTREGAPIPKSTLCDWAEQTANVLEPVVNAMEGAMRGALRIHTDDTGIPILEVGGTHRGHVWVYVGDNGAGEDEHVIFKYTKRRKGDGPREFLRGYKGYVQADAANLYDRLFGSEAGEADGAKEVGCWAHTRRYFFEAQLSDKSRALVALGFIKKLYEADDVVAKLPPSRRTDERRRLSTPILDGFKAWLDAEALVVLPKAPIAEAIGYARNQWGALTRFLEDARLRLDNNTAERALRRVAVGRKNWLFAGSETGAETACTLYSILATCRLHGVNPFDYLRDVLPRIAAHPQSDVLALSPKAWNQARQKREAESAVVHAS